MTEQQQEAVRLLSKCRLYHWRERNRVHVWALMLQCDPASPIAPHEDLALMSYLHHYRRQHRRCMCDRCFTATMEKMAQVQLGLFGEGVDR